MTFKVTFSVFVLLMLLTKNAYSQNNSIETINETPSVDTSLNFNKKPQIAALASAIVPGLGQVYNKKYWKAPIIWGSGLALYAYFDYNNTHYKRFKDASSQLIEGVSVTDPELVGLTQDNINYYKDEYRRDRDKAIIYMGILYVANIVDAMVDAHLLHYDISNNLTLHWEPAVIQSSPKAFTPESYALGAKVHLRF